MYVGGQQWLHIYVKRSTVTTNVCLGSFRVAVHIYVGDQHWLHMFAGDQWWLLILIYDSD